MHEIWRMVQQLLLNYFKDINFHNDCIRMKWKLCVGFWCTCMCVLLFFGGVGGGRYQSDKFSVLRFQRTSINLACMLFNGMQSAWGFVRTRWYCIACMYAFTISVSELILIYQFKGLEVFLFNFWKPVILNLYFTVCLNYYYWTTMTVWFKGNFFFALQLYVEQNLQFAFLDINRNNWTILCNFLI